MSIIGEFVVVKNGVFCVNFMFLIKKFLGVGRWIMFFLRSCSRLFNVMIDGCYWKLFNNIILVFFVFI